MRSPTADLRAALSGFQGTLWTAMPAVVQSYDATAGTVEAQPTIQAQVLGPTGVWISQAMPICVDCPVVFPGGGSFGITFPIAAGDEGLLVFASRCIDAWWQQGGVQKQAELRMHDLSDGFFFPTMGMSQQNLPPNVNTANVQIRDKSGTLFLEFDPVTSQCNILAPGGLWVNGLRVTVP